MFMNMNLTVPIILGEALLHVTITRSIYMSNVYFYLLYLEYLNFSVDYSRKIYIYIKMVFNATFNNISIILRGGQLYW